MIRVLVIEDNPGDARLLKEFLAEANTPFSMETVGNLAAAIHRIQEGGLDVILCDLSLPDSHGIGTFTRIYECAREIPIIILSGLDDEAVAVQTVEAGAQDYLVKGHVDPHLLGRAIRYAIKRTESDRALAEERNLLRSVIDNLLDAIYVKDTQGHYLLDNVAHLQALGCSMEAEVAGKTVFDFFPKEMAEKFEADDQSVVATGKPILNREERVTDGNGALRWISTTKVPFRNREEKIIGVVGIRRDITHRKQAEEQLAAYNRELSARNAEMEDDLRMAREIQQAFVAQQYPSFPFKATPEESALLFCSRYLPATVVGGDFFHILPLSETRAGVFICDVMGHGVRAALVTAVHRALVEENLDIAHEPGKFLEEINRALLSILKRTGTPMFSSAFYLVADVSTGEMRYANAGHPKPLHIRRDEGIVAFMDGGEQRSVGPALGLFEDCAYPTCMTHLATHDLVMLFTDGLFEVEGPGGGFYDEGRLFAAVKRRIRMPAPVLFDEVLEEVQNFSLSHGFVDDVCLVGMEVQRMEEATQ